MTGSTTGAAARLDDQRILVAEDEYVVAEAIAAVLAEAGAEVFGPMPTVARALRAATAPGRLDAALLDVNLRGELIWPVVDALRARRARGARHRLRPERHSPGLRSPATLREAGDGTRVGVFPRPRTGFAALLQELRPTMAACARHAALCCTAATDNRRLWSSRLHTLTRSTLLRLISPRRRS